MTGLPCWHHSNNSFINNNNTISSNNNNNYTEIRSKRPIRFPLNYWVGTRVDILTVDNRWLAKRPRFSFLTRPNDFSSPLYDTRHQIDKTS
jgi:hypothetical protein